MRRQVLAALAVTVIATVSANGAYKCTGTQYKCAGEANYPYVEYVPCCSKNDECTYAPHLGWGKFCMPQGYATNEKPAYKPEPHSPVKEEYKPVPPREESTCYNDNVRCMGAAGYAHYQYKQCCNKHATCEEDSALGWGKFCKAPSGYKAPEPKYMPVVDETYEKEAAQGYKQEYKPVLSPEYKPVPPPEFKPVPPPAYEAEAPHHYKYNNGHHHPKEESSCYNDNVRCMGAAGHAHYQYKRCCNKHATCEEDRALGWGKFCMVRGGYKAPEPEYTTVVEETYAKPGAKGYKEEYKPTPPKKDEYKPTPPKKDEYKLTPPKKDEYTPVLSPEYKPAPYPEYKPVPPPEYKPVLPSTYEAEVHHKSPTDKHDYKDDKSYKQYEEEPSCYSDNVMCMEPAGYTAHYQHKPCCNKHATCVEDGRLGKGKFCKAPDNKAYTPETTYKKEAENDYGTDIIIEERYGPKDAYIPIVTEPKYKVDSHCSDVNERCAGEAGKRTMEWKKCCRHTDVCVEDASMGWGRFCKAPHKAVYYNEPKCTGADKACGNEYDECCAGYACVKVSQFLGLGSASVCKQVSTKAYVATTTPPTVYKPEYIAPTLASTDYKPAYVAPTLPPTDYKPAYVAPTLPPTDYKPAYVAPTLPPTDYKPAYVAPTLPLTDHKPEHVSPEKKNERVCKKPFQGCDVGNDCCLEHMDEACDCVPNKLMARKAERAGTKFDGMCTPVTAPKDGVEASKECVAPNKACVPDKDCCAPGRGGAPHKCSPNAIKGSRAARSGSSKIGICTPVKVDK